MQIGTNMLFLGTGAADWAQDKNVNGEHRRFSACMLKRDLLIDAGPCLSDFAQTFQYDDLYKNVQNLIITHSHSDHFNIEQIRKLNAITGGNLQIWSCKKVMDLLKAEGFDALHLLEAEGHYRVGDYSITPVLSNHCVEETNEETFQYIIYDHINNKNIFYGCDGAWLTKSAWMQIYKTVFDCMVFDCTIGDVNGDYRIFEHNSIKMIEYMLETLRSNGCINEKTIILASHFARTLHTNHEELVKRLEKSGILAAFDAMDICIE